MGLALTITSWVAVVLGVLAVLGGFFNLATLPTTAYYDFAGGVMFAGEGILALVYINQTEEK
jgi:hypothetical protein